MPKYFRVQYLNHHEIISPRWESPLQSRSEHFSRLAQGRQTPRCPKMVGLASWFSMIFIPHWLMEPFQSNSKDGRNGCWNGQNGRILDILWFLQQRNMTRRWWLWVWTKAFLRPPSNPSPASNYQSAFLTIHSKHRKDGKRKQNPATKWWGLWILDIIR